jgi:DnaK suppressor protein
MAAKKKTRYTKKELEHFEKLLLEKRAKLIEELGYIEDSNLFQSQKDQGGELSGYSNHMADAAADYTSLETNFDLAEREGKYLVYLNEALDRVKEGTYGICKDCMDEPLNLCPTCPLIPKERLEAVPTATKCVACKEEGKRREEKERQQELARMYLAQHQRMKRG